MDPDFPEGFSYVAERYGRHVGTRTPDLYRVNFEVNNLKPFPHLAFPHFLAPENTPKQPSFDGELMASLPSSRPLNSGTSALLSCRFNGVRALTVWLCLHIATLAIFHLACLKPARNPLEACYESWIECFSWIKRWISGD
jgi:hypothetical protein